MNLYFRLIRVLITALIAYRRRRERIAFHGGVSELHFRCLPTDCDINGHMTHSRYGSFSDIGRIDWSIRVGLAKTIRRNGWSGMAAAFHVEYRNEIKPFEKFIMRTRFLTWEGSNALAEHTYYVVRDGEEVLAARGLARVGFYSRAEKRFIQGDEIAQALGEKPTPPEVGAVEMTFLKARLTTRGARRGLKQATRVEK